MMRAIVGVLCAALLSGCATSRMVGGTYSEIPAGYSDVMAIDAVNQLSHIHPPASSRLVVKGVESDAFGQALVRRLRAAGFAVQEGTVEGAPSGTALVYILDQLDETTYRVSLLVAGETLSRAYIVADRRLAPSGVWSRGS